jgi:hypothetical protein
MAIPVAMAAETPAAETRAMAIPGAATTMPVEMAMEIPEMETEKTTIDGNQDAAGARLSH